MPLLANQGVVLTNQQDVVEIPGECKEENCLFIGTVCKDKECKDKECKDRDTYSVLASFGAKFSGEAAGGPKATGGLAQYFATGLAARILAKEGGAKIVSVQPEAIYYKEVEKQLEESSRILRCYVSIREDDLPKIWEDAKKQGLFREEDSFDVIMKWYQEAIGNPTVRAENLRKAHRRYASEIYITEGADPQRVNALRKHRETVCGLARE
ncbi:MAG: hypothetical protein Q8O04_09930 [Deltaproteobacteria bacterium]|nr:hypothetical protein [Deltaproteobacteria bacterium]